MYRVVLDKNIILIGYSGHGYVIADVAIENGKIVAIEKIPDSVKAAKIVDVSGEAFLVCNPAEKTLNLEKAVTMRDGGKIILFEAFGL